MIMKKITLIITLCTVFFCSIFAQSDKQALNFNIEGQIALARNANALYIYLGGPLYFSISLEMLFKYFQQYLLNIV